MRDTWRWMSLVVLLGAFTYVGCGPTAPPESATTTESEMDAEADEYSEAVDSGEYDPDAGGDTGSDSESE